MSKLGIASLGIASVIIGGAIGLSPQAQAIDTELAYLATLEVRGVTVLDSSAAIQTGYAVCGALDSVNGTVVVGNLRRLNATLTERDATAVLVTAVEYLCPWHDHTDDA
ncbi:hypothetical protein PBI_LUCKY2013_216 [Mycobacterium phage Lucky2013]|uniref:hypothetical protein n=1 Tax=Mycobacterium phage Minerva TaxID=1527513 RepID=UPI0004EF92CE|nr:hypothetical protein VC71_gp205 [Mycobacterium phage Minerva]YP_009213443.1 hypothetical protein AVV70_gp211 [Mycobacterium phage MiaZeal]ASD50826.1 hypothetical protein PORCELAIN_219 [Mycobacterium phage Porcelain]ASD53607.1 hypothetical protein PBI_LUCKY2013_216 [Mycobacterium phage Lucky2013]QCO93900.1 hypothetical protein SEA_SCHATZIE_212 [Mycobacterium phage Schatzie]AIK69426.1 hypothetical protein PBI_MINERVA_218 [Mycobacterium phage Minerva]AIY32580.1 hypothetical protein PBI_MIAZEA